MKYPLDACALIAFFDAEEGGLTISDLIVTPTAQLKIHSVNMCEVFYHFLRKYDLGASNKVLSDVLSFGIEIFDEIGPNLWKDAAALKAQYKRLSLADAIGVAYARSIDGIFVTADHSELEPLDKDGVCDFFFFR
jgi:PIN domain nuclease of toxin-antitoxin system